MKDNKFISDVLYADNESKSKELTVNQNNSVQPVAFMRLGIFVPKPKKSNAPSPTLDASSELTKLEIARAEGYDSVQIIGPRLDMDTDFKVWVGIIRAFSKYGLNSNRIRMKFSEFAKDCGFTSKRLDSVLRSEIHDSLIKIRSKTISFKRGKDTRGSYTTGLLKMGFFDADTDVVELEADERLWDLYEANHLVLLQQHAIKVLPRKEAAQAIYTFIESLPNNPAPVGFNRLRERLSLISEIKEQNRVVKRAVEQLIDIGYLQATIKKEGQENFLLIHSRNPKLKPFG
ncbi:protein RepA [Enterobacter soli]|uniref:protein RepA n=1 Tax=Enterobacter soli TaxID=885040 RepID=UPI002F3E2F66